MFLSPEFPEPISPSETALTPLKTWCLTYLPELNAQAFAEILPYQVLAEQLNEAVLARLPDPPRLNVLEAQQLLVLLSFVGSSVERHAQQQYVRQAFGGAVTEFAQRAAAIHPGHGLACLRVNGAIPFTQYYAAIADRVGHPHRDSLLGLVEWNGPSVQVFHPTTGVLLYTLPGVFPDGAFLTFSGTATERNFYTLGKTMVALQTATNHFLSQLQDPSQVLRAPEKQAAALHAVCLMETMRATILDFMKNKEFDVAFFLDVFRQYQCPWFTDRYLKPPSAANDSASLLRDVILFANLVPPQPHFPGFRDHVRQIFSVLIPEQRAELEQAMVFPSLEQRLEAEIGLSRQELNGLDSADLRTLIQQHPWLLTYLLLYNTQRDLSRTHYALVQKYIIRPKKERDVTGDTREYVTVVDNARGTTGMDPMGIMIQLDEARGKHPLNRLNGELVVREMSGSYLRSLGYTERSPEALRQLVSLLPEAFNCLQAGAV